jgi:hypothetical protein
MNYLLEETVLPNYFQEQNFLKWSKDNAERKKMAIFKKIKKLEKNCFDKTVERQKNNKFSLLKALEKKSKAIKKIEGPKILYTLNDINSLKFMNYAKNNCRMLQDEEIKVTEINLPFFFYLLIN